MEVGKFNGLKGLFFGIRAHRHDNPRQWELCLYFRKSSYWVRFPARVVGDQVVGA